MGTGTQAQYGYDDDNYDDDGSEMLEFAKEALAKAAMMAADLAARKKVCAAGCLAANLLIAKTALDAALASQLAKLQRRLPKLLQDLEYVCMWPKQPNPHESILKAILRSPKHQHASQRQAEDRARRGLLAFTSASQGIRDQYLKKLERFAKPVLVVDEDDIVRGDGHKTTPDETPDEYPTHVNTNLYSVLKSHSRCTCTWAGGQAQHHARLRLKDQVVKVDGCVAFDMLFSATPTGLEHWQDLQIRVSMRKKAAKVVRYHDEQPAAHCTSNSDEAKPVNNADAAERFKVIQPESFCRLVKTRMGSRICCRIQDEELHQLYDGFPLSQQVGPGSSTSLRKVLGLCRLSNRMKLVLAYIVARSFWQFYDSPWMDAPWSSDTIHFLPESPLEVDDDDASIASDLGSEHSGPGAALFASRPCFAVEFDNDQRTEGPPEYCDSYSVVYRYPRLLALCAMLLEIAQGQSLALESEESMEANLNSSWTLLRRHAKRTRLWKEFDFPDYRKAVLTCLNYKPDANDNKHDGNPSNPDEDVFTRKALVYSAVVQPLERLLKALGFAENLHMIDPIDLSRIPDRVVELPDAVPVASLTSRQGTGGNSSAQAAAQWLSSINSINAAIRERARGRKAGGRHSPVRIAVLDTGYDGETVFFTVPARQRRIKGWKDFAEGCETAVDANGHGTHTLALIMKVAPAADMYVARVAKDRAGLQNASDAIAQAINWAANEASVDVVAMAFGFPDEVPEITRAILEAQLRQNNKIIFLGAASNSGANGREAFPAALDSVISVRETNSQGAFSDSNPPVDPHGPIVFGTLGKDVPSVWLSSVAGEVPKSGSSVATAVAAGIVAMILDFVHVGLADAEAKLPSEIDRVWTRQGMTAVLTRMSHDMGNRSHFISPISFFSGKDMTKSWTAISDAVTG